MSDRYLQIQDTQQLGAFVQAVRKAQQLRQDEVGRISHSFIGDLEAGKPTVQLGKVLDVLNDLGVKVRLELPPGMDSKLIDTLRDSQSTP